MEPVSLLVLLIIALVAGVFGALLGLGGAVIIIPAFTLILNLPIHTAIGASIVAVIATSSAAATVYVGERITNIRLGMLLEVGTTVGAMTGALLATSLNTMVLSLVFGFVALYGAVYMILTRKKEAEEGVVAGSEIQPDRFGLAGEYYDGALDTRIAYRVRGLGKGMAFSVLAGEVSGMLGVGGGIIKVPVMHYFMKIPMKVATATSNFMIGVTAVASAYIYYSRGFVDPLLTVPTAIGVFVGAQAGSRIAYRVRGATTRNIFALVLLYISIRMILEGVGVTLPF